MSWDSLGMYALVSGICWVIGAYGAFRNHRKVAVGVTGLGSLVFFLFIIGLWMSLERPPLRTMGETRLWYSFFLSVIGLILYIKCKYKWILSFSTLMSLVFVFVNLLKPEIHSKTLMPALQSAWFVPHVIVYMFSYAMMGAVTLFAIYLWFRKSPDEVSDKEWSTLPDFPSDRDSYWGWELAKSNTITYSEGASAIWISSTESKGLFS